MRRAAPGPLACRRQCPLPDYVASRNRIASIGRKPAPEPPSEPAPTDPPVIRAAMAGPQPAPERALARAPRLQSGQETPAKELPRRRNRNQGNQDKSIRPAETPNR